MAESQQGPRVSVLFVCLGNICRSPTAEGVVQSLVDKAGLSAFVRLDSAGTNNYHQGEEADPRTRRAAAARGVKITHRARQVVPSDFEQFDLLLALDVNNEAVLLGQAPPAAKASVKLFRSYDPESPARASVPDPYFGGVEGFEEVLDQCERAGTGLLAELRRVYKF